MNPLALLRERFAAALTQVVPETDNLDALLDMVRPSADAKFGDYQANCAMPLGKKIGQAPRDVAQSIVDHLKVDDLCHPPELAGPGFINLRLRDDWIIDGLQRALADSDRLDVQPAADPRTYVIDYSAPNVAKPMHVGHIRSTVIGDCLYRVLSFLGHSVISDNHIGDWGTQFGMIIYGFKHFRDQAAYDQNAVAELSRLYRLVNRLVDYHQSRQKLPELENQIAQRQAELDKPPISTGDSKADKKAAKQRKRQQAALAESKDQLQALTAKLAAVEQDADLAKLAVEHQQIGADMLAETAKLHAGDEENLRLWREFLPPCLADIETIYRRLDVTFDQTLGESFYHDRLADVVVDLQYRGMAVESEGAQCVFLDGFDQPMIVQKRDGAFLYATTDLATIRYRGEQWNPDTVLYVVDHRQSLHFEQLFAAARRAGYGADMELKHVSFGTVIGDDGRPFKTRSGDTVGLGGLLDEAERRAYSIVCKIDDAKPDGRELSDDDRRRISTVVGVAAIKYADLSQNRTSDYVFSYDKMLATEGNTSTYMQYAYARVRNIFRRGQVDIDSLRSQSNDKISLDHPAERALAIELLRISESLSAVVIDDRPNFLTAYLFELAKRYSTFYNDCPVLKADTDEQRTSRLLLCDLTARTLKLGLSLLGIEVVERM